MSDEKGNTEVINEELIPNEVVPDGDDSNEVIKDEISPSEVVPDDLIPD